MVEIVPFKGYLYNQEKTGPAEQVIAPPYDVISPGEQDQLYEKNPYNVVRLILGKQFPQDTDQDNRYTRSARTFQEWTGSGILVQDREPGFYVYSQDYTFQGKSLSRTGFFARVKLEELSSGKICPHEFTLAKAKQDRAQLLQACRANFSPIFGLFSDPEHLVDKKLAGAKDKEPVARIENGAVTHRFWRLEDIEAVQFIKNSFTEKKVYIADGHHRYETALAYYKEHGREVPDASHVMMFLTNLDSEAMSIYPIHRMIRCPEPFDRGRFLNRLDEFFAVEPLAPEAASGDIRSVLENSGRKAISFVLYLGKGEKHLLQLRNTQSIVAHLQPDEPEALQVLDVAQLHALVIRFLLNVDTKQTGHQQYVSYTVDIDEAMRRVDAEEFDLAFFVNATKMDQVRKLAEQGIRLPQKATYFFPKLLSGLVINKFES